MSGQLFKFSWVYTLFRWIFGMIGKIIDWFTFLLEGESGLLWGMVFLILLYYGYWDKGITLCLFHIQVVGMIVIVAACMLPFVVPNWRILITTLAAIYLIQFIYIFYLINATACSN